MAFLQADLDDAAGAIAVPDAPQERENINRGIDGGWGIRRPEAGGLRQRREALRRMQEQRAEQVPGPQADNPDAEEAAAALQQRQQDEEVGVGAVPC